jgi:ATP-dependent Clp protease adaptor protein ClpS
MSVLPPSAQGLVVGGRLAISSATHRFAGMSCAMAEACPLSDPPLMAGRQSDDDHGTGLGIATKAKPKTKKPSHYKVLMLNDDYTPMEFVVLCLQRFFRMSIEDATRVMLHVHQRGVGVCGVFSYEIAETKVSQVIDFARQNQHPLQCTLEKA